MVADVCNLIKFSSTLVEIFHCDFIREKQNMLYNKSSTRILIFNVLHIFSYYYENTNNQELKKTTGIEVGERERERERERKRETTGESYTQGRERGRSIAI